jgi:predicted acetyltransferase
LSVTFRFARPADVEAVVLLTGHSFPGVGRDREWWMERYRETAYGDGAEIIWVGEEGGRLVASCQLHRIEHWVAGVKMPSMGLGTVAIAPTHRQRGLAGRMVSTALRAARDRGDLLSSLYPFRASFYGRFGYGLAGDTHQYHVAPSALPDSDTREAVEVLEQPAGRAEAAAFYESWAPTQTGQLRRTEKLWDELAGGTDRLLVGFRGTDSRLGGYALATYPTQLPPNERYLSVEELAWTSAEARRGLYGWLASMGDQWRGIALRALPEHRLQDWLREPRLNGGPGPGWGLWFPSAVVLRGPMFRLLSVADGWGARATQPESRMTVGIDVTDEELPENAGSWLLRLESGRVVVERGDGAADLRLRLGIQTLGRLYMGSLPPTAAVEAGLAEVDRPGRLGELDRALQLPGCWTFDRY